MKIIIYIIGTIILICGCKQHQKYSTLSSTVINPLEDAITISSFDKYIDSLQVIQLEASPQSFITYIKKVLITQNKDFIILNSTGVLVFSQAGNFLFKIGEIGRGPEEYIAARDICITNDYKYLLVLDCTNQVIKYNIQNGEFQERIIPEMDDPKKLYLDFGEICPSNNGGFFLYCCNPPDISDFNQDFYCLIEFDKNGNFLNKYLKRKDFVFPSNIISQSYDNNYLIRPQEGDNICYKIINDSIIPIVTIDFKDKYIPLHHVYPKPGEGFPIQEYMFSDYYKLPIYIHDTQDLFYFGCCAPKGKDTYFLFSNKSLKGVRWENDPIEEDIFIFEASDSNYLYGVYNDYKEYTSQERQNMKNPLKRYILTKTNISLITDQQNPAIIKMKFKL